MVFDSRLQLEMLLCKPRVTGFRQGTVFQESSGGLSGELGLLFLFFSLVQMPSVDDPMLSCLLRSVICCEWRELFLNMGCMLVHKGVY